MVIIKNGSREKKVSENEVDLYLRQGWKVINQKGEEIEYVKPITYDQAIKKIGELEAYIEQLKASLTEAGAKIKALEKKKAPKGE